MSKTQELLNQALQLLRQNDLDSAEKQLKRLLRTHPHHGEALHMLGAIFATRQDLPGAIKCFQKALSANPKNARIQFNLAQALAQSGQETRALGHFQIAVELEPGLSTAWSLYGNTLHKLQRCDDALACYDHALQLNPNDAATWANRGITLTTLTRYEEALTAHDRAIALGFNNNALVWDNRAITLNLMNRQREAFDSYAKALTLNPNADFIFGSWLHSKMMLCDWQYLNQAFDELAARISAGQKQAPFVVVTTPLSAKMLRQCTANFIGGSDVAQPAFHQHDNTQRITIGYFSADFHSHATTYLMAGLFEHHDKERFNIIAFSFGPDQQDAMRQRIAAACDQFIDVRDKSDAEVAALSRSLQVDIAIDLKGFTTNNRFGIFAHRAAPIQVNYLGYPGTLGASFIDYLIADSMLITDATRPFYSENIVYLPNSYQVNDNTREISPRHYTRRELGLPEHGFVFCCFNNSYKITPDVFDVWMRLLNKIPGSVLWLIQDHAEAITNLQREAEKRGIARARLIFAARTPLAEHLARHRCADLFLDTFHCNAHTTASDALWAGLPVVTHPGKTFASRVAASLLNAVALPELITHTEQEYESLAYTLANEPEKLQHIRGTLAAQHATSPLFDTALFTRHLENAYEKMMTRYQSGLAPEDIAISQST